MKNQVSQKIYPSHSGKSNNLNNDYLIGMAKSIIILCQFNEKHSNKALREIIGGVFNYLEKNEGFQYHVSEGFKNSEHLAINGGYNPNGDIFILEHIVPHIVLVKQIRDLNFTEPEHLLHFLRNNYYLCLVTKDEDKLLRAKGLSKKMPAEYYDPNSPLYMDPFARYSVAGIELKK